jgi:hypothetical protein
MMVFQCFSACPETPVAKGFFASRGKWTMSNAEWTIFRAAEAMPSFGTSPPGPLSSKERGKRGLGGKGGEVQENNEKLTIDNTEWTIFRAAELYYPLKRY